LLASVTDGS